MKERISKTGKFGVSLCKGKVLEDQWHPVSHAKFDFVQDHAYTRRGLQHAYVGHRTCFDSSVSVYSSSVLEAS